MFLFLNNEVKILVKRYKALFKFPDIIPSILLFKRVIIYFP